MRSIALACLCATLTANVAAAEGARAWTVREDGSRLGFVASWEGTEFDGVFHRYTADIRFDPADLADSRFAVDVDVTSTDTQSSDRDEGLADPEWFDYEHYPHATYTTSSIRALDGGRYEATGTLTIKGIAKEITLPFQWDSQDGVAHLHGETTLVRTDFKVGEGEWAEADPVGLDVRVKVDVELDAQADGS
jgi:polyisoprenoid-binding protein YceI